MTDIESIKTETWVLELDNKLADQDLSENDLFRFAVVNAVEPKFRSVILGGICFCQRPV